MMVPLLLSVKSRFLSHQIPMERFYRYIGISRQGFYKAVTFFKQNQSMLAHIRTLVTMYRREKDRRAGSRSLFYNLNIKNRFDIGVTKFEQLLSKEGLSLFPLRVRVVTTQSSMQSWNYTNLVNGITISDINQVVVGDLTYVYLNGKRYYLFCLTDLYSARIVGYHMGRNMRAVDAKSALDMWIRVRKGGSLKRCIHHTDGGSQYFSQLYLGVLKQLEIAVSCAENCLMNGYAEQRNGLIKHHLLPTIEGGDQTSMDKEMKRIMHIYNNERKQKELGWLSPVEFEKNILGKVGNPKVKLYNFKGK